jgi:hypothetical protein
MPAKRGSTKRKPATSGGLLIRYRDEDTCGPVVFGIADGVHAASRSK